MGRGTPGGGHGDDVPATGSGEPGIGLQGPQGARGRRGSRDLRASGGSRATQGQKGLQGLQSDIADPGLAAAGSARIEWAEREMPVARLLRQRFAAEQPFAGLKVASCLHVTAETAVFLRALCCGGAAVSLAASNPLSTQDEVAAALAAHEGITVFARAGVDRRTYYQHIGHALGAWAGQDSGASRPGGAGRAGPEETGRAGPAGDGRAGGAGGPQGPGEPGGRVGPWGPDLVIDDGGDLVNVLHTQRAGLLRGVRGGCESTATGVIRLRRMAAEGALAFPVIAANDTPAKRLVDGTCGTGQSVIDGILRATNTLLAGKTVVVAGFGACGRGVADRARGLGAEVIVTEVDPVRALEAVLHGFRVLPMAEAAQAGQVFVTATGSAGVIGAEHMAQMPDGAILANAGHFDVEIDIPELERLAAGVRRSVRPHVDSYEMADGRQLLLLAEGRVVNLVAAEGHPAQVMDLSFGVQALALAWLARNAAQLPPDVHAVPAAIDAEAARLELAAIGTRIDALTPAQSAYLDSWRPGSWESWCLGP